MITRYRIHRGPRPPSDPLPPGSRQDTRKHTRHCLRPDSGSVRRYLSAPSDAAWARFAEDYEGLLDDRFREDRVPFDALVTSAMEGDVYLGCSCPTRANPDVRHCHTWLALEFLRDRYPDLEVVFPRVDPSSPGAGDAARIRPAVAPEGPASNR